MGVKHQIKPAGLFKHGQARIGAGFSFLENWIQRYV